MAAATAAPSVIPSTTGPAVSVVTPAAATTSSAVSANGIPSTSASSLLGSESVWQSLLQRTSRRKELLPHASLILLGDKGAGKSSILRAFNDRTVSDLATQYVVQFGYINVKNAANADREDVLGRLNIWTLDDPAAAPQLVPMLLSTNYGSAAPASLYAAYDSAVVAVCVDLSEPWSVSAQLQRWYGAVAAIKERVFQQLSKDERAALLRKISLHTQAYYNTDLTATTPTQPADSAAAAPVPDSVTGLVPPSAADSGAALNPHVPETNYGVPVVLVGTKADAFTRQPAAPQWSSLTVDDRFEFIVYLLRNYALPSASALFLTSAASSSSTAAVDALQSYLYHRLYRFPFTTPPQPLATEESYAVCIPAGYDTVELIQASQTRDGRWNSVLTSSDVFRAEKRREHGVSGETKDGKGSEVRALDDAAFVKTIKQQLDSNSAALPSAAPILPSSASVAASAAAAPSPASSKSRGGVTVSLRSSPTSGSPSSSLPSTPNSKQKLNPKGQVAVKAFFKSLLQQPAGSGGAGLDGGSAAGSKRSSMNVRKDAEMELKRMSEAAQAKKEVGEQKE